MTVRFVVPRTSVPSGGNTYNRRIAEELSRSEHPTRTVAVAGDWPRPGPGALDGLSRALDEAPDGSHVLVDGLVACGAPDVLVPRAGRLRLAVLVHLPLADETGLAESTARELDARERAVLRCGATVVATSAWAARRLAAHHGLTEVAVVEPGVDPAPPARGSGFERADSAVPRLVCVASLTPRKGHDLLFRALSGLRDLGWACVCAGPGTPPPHPEVADRIRFTGPVAGSELAGVYDSADLLVLASRAETYGMVVTEALARGVPVVAAGVGGVPAALGRTADGRVPGLLVPPEDPGALASALRGWLTDPRLREELRGAARQRREELTGWPGSARALAQALGL